MAATDAKDAIREFKDAVNMTPKELERWLETDDSKEVGWKEDGDDESTGHASGRRIVELLGKKQAEYGDDDVKHMRKVVSYVRRHLAQRPEGDVEDTRWCHSLMNWGHDPLKQMMRRVFVFGTLKRGFPLHDEGMKGASCLGAYRTVAPYPLVVAGPQYAPMMFDEPGIGRRVSSEVYEADDERLKLLDALESVPQAGNERITAEVEPLGGGATQSALMYVKSRNLAMPIHTDYLEDYRDRRFVHRSRRP